MKKITKLFLVVIMACISASAFAQTPKFAHINFQEFVMLSPESDSASVKLEAFGKELQDQIEGMQKELQDKFTIYQQQQGNWTAGVLEAKQKELQDLNQRMEEFRQVAQQDFQQKQQELMLPILEKARKTISTVAKRENFIYVFDTSTGALSYFDEQQSTDLLPMVKKELNITKELPRTNR
ncbi:MAG: OmpH family outer membrane protein [Prevotellaceae bacterium]|jgi:outer membrane protein|nr:OmpH family outer membrane protein [Prevotellaceae bacterium]